MKIAVGCDHGGFQLKKKIIAYLTEKGYQILNLGCNSEESVDYPKYGKAVGKAVVEKEADVGIIICGTGIGISIAANKIKDVRAALCTNSTMAKLTREHNDANILAIGGRIVGDAVAFAMIDTFLNTSFQGGRHQNRIDKIEN